MKIFVVVRWINPTDLSMMRVPKYEVMAFSKTEYADGYMRLYSVIGDQLFEVDLDERVPEMKKLIDNLAISFQSAITVPCKVD